MGRSRGGFSTKIHALVDARGQPLYVTLTPGQRHDSTVAEELITHARAKACVADTAYDSARIVSAIRARRMRVLNAVNPDDATKGQALLVRVVRMLSKLCR